MNEERVMEKRGMEKSPEAKKLMFSILLALAALVSLVAASVAWFTIADFTKVHSMSMDITSGTNLRFDLDAHGTFEEYVKTLNFNQIAARMLREKGYDMRVTPIEPVTTEDYVTFRYEDGTVVEAGSGAYLEFVLHFYATEDMLVHLTSVGTQGGQGTGVSSSNGNLPKAMRISFTADDTTYVYDPGLGDELVKGKHGRIFGLPRAEDMVLNQNNQMFWLEKNQDKPVTVHVWLEGTDEACTDKLRKADYAISLRFVGTDENNNILDGARKGTEE